MGDEASPSPPPKKNKYKEDKEKPKERKKPKKKKYDSDDDDDDSDDDSSRKAKKPKQRRRRNEPKAPTKDYKIFFSVNIQTAENDNIGDTDDDLTMDGSFQETIKEGFEMEEDPHVHIWE